MRGKLGSLSSSQPFRTQENLASFFCFYFITRLQLAPKIGSLFLLLIKGNTLNASNDITQCIIRSELHSHSEVTNHGAINERKKKQEGLRSEHARMPVILHIFL